MVLQQKLYTIEEFEAYLLLPENADRFFELIDGGIVEKVPTELHSIVSGNFYTALRGYVKPRKLGRVVFEVRYRVSGDEHNARMPDVSFTSAVWVQPVVEKGPVPQIPDLGIEVQSPNDSPAKMREKAAYYLANGAKMVWLAYPKKRMVEALYPDGEFDIFRADDRLSGGDLLSDFSIRMSELFEE